MLVTWLTTDPMPMTLRPGPDKDPLRWELQSHLSILCTRWYKVVQSFCPNAGISLWGVYLHCCQHTQLYCTCMVALEMFVYWWKSVEIVECVVPVVLVSISVCVQCVWCVGVWVCMHVCVSRQCRQVVLGISLLIERCRLLVVAWSRHCGIASLS